MHGFGFSFALRETLQFAGSHLLTSLLSFNVGVELGQLLVLLLLIPALDLLFRYVVAERMGTIILSALVAHTAWHWMLERADRLRQYSVRWPEWNPVLAAGIMRSLAALLLLAAAVWWTFAAWRRRRSIMAREVLADEGNLSVDLSPAAGVCAEGGPAEGAGRRQAGQHYL